jgi:hypothetical protein
MTKMTPVEAMEYIRKTNEIMGNGEIDSYNIRY